jgi:hypothetical protein
MHGQILYRVQEVHDDRNRRKRDRVITTDQVVAGVSSTADAVPLEAVKDEFVGVLTTICHWIQTAQGVMVLSDDGFLDYTEHQFLLLFPAIKK